MVGVDEGVLGDALFSHGFPKTIIGNHAAHPLRFDVDIITENGVQSY